MKKLLLFIGVLLAVQASIAAPVSLHRMRCEMLDNPEGIDVAQPRLSWEILSADRGVMQVAYQVIVASSVEKLAADNGDLWNSGKVNSSQSVHVTYKGLALKSRMDCYWKVKVWTSNGETEWTAPAHWSMGLINYVDWKARWIGLDKLSAWDKEELNARLSARYLRKEFDAKDVVAKAKVYIMGLGLYELYINGSRIGNQVLAPAPTDYGKGIKYNVFDVTTVLKQGKNAIGTILGNGRFYAMRQASKPYKIKTFGYPKMMLQLEVEYKSGKKETIITDDTWSLTADGPIRTNNEYDGEEYDATKELKGWSSIGFSDAAWQKAPLVQEPGGNFEAQMNPPMRIMKTVQPVAIKALNAQTYILDMGQNMAGWLQLKNINGKRGEKITLKFAETLQKDGSLYIANLRDAQTTDVYTLSGEGNENWEPRFVYHGFRYVAITGFTGKPTLANFEGKVVYDDMATNGSFETSNPVINQVYKNAWWGIAGNYKGMPVDCPQRNERQPWLGDRTTGCFGESFLFDNGRLYAKWLDDIQQSQKADGSIPDVAPAFWRYYGDNVTWPGTYLSVAEMLLQQYADTVSLKKHYASMKLWMLYMKDRYSNNGLVTKDKYGDWCVPPENLDMIHSQDSLRNTDGALIASATYIHYLQVMKKFATTLSLTADAALYDQYAVEMSAAFNKAFYKKDIGCYSNNSVTANLLPLSFGLVPITERDKVLANIVQKITVENNHHISTGVIGTQWLMRGLSANGYTDIAYKLASNSTYPSWGYMAANGATTIWELWNGNTAAPAMNSGNHVMLLGDLLVWEYENIAGIKAGSPGFKTIVMEPSFVEGLQYASGSYHSIYGDIKSSWKKTGKKIEWKVTIPANTTAELRLPVKDMGQIREAGKELNKAEGVQRTKADDGAVLLVGSGDYVFEF